jgi:SAM-dependent methyltransferase
VRGALLNREKVRADFDRIARLDVDESAHLSIYDDFVLGRIQASTKPLARPVRILEIGCGTGGLTRALGTRCGPGASVLGIDLSPEMIRVARARTTGGSIRYECGDFFELELPRGENGGFDVVVSVATMHHLPLLPALRRMVDLLVPGGLLLVHDLRANEGVVDRAMLPFAVLARAIARVRAGKLISNARLRAAWNDHARGERYLTRREAVALSREPLPGATVTSHLQWRYTLEWRRPFP